MNRRDFLIRSGAAASIGLLTPDSLLAQASSAPAPSRPASPGQAVPVAQPPPVTTFKALRRNVGTFTGGGGTIGWLSNKDALAAVDTQFPNTAAIFLKDLPGRDGRRLDVTINTHHHGDHTGGNAVFRPETKSIVAQANVPGLMYARAEADKKILDPAMVPDVTFREAKKIVLGDEIISARYLGAAHTNGDIVVHFEKANVVHLGDLLFNRIYPVIDRPGGASIKHWVTVVETIHADYPADAVFVSGHGNAKFGITLQRDELLVFRDYLSALLATTEAGIKAGKSKEEIQKLENMPGFADFHVPPGRGNRLPGNLATAYDELTAI
jgi:glyoxylase-like metal-dependent hydrolase (beta-lactamase superfamily II)